MLQPVSLFPSFAVPSRLHVGVLPHSLAWRLQGGCRGRPFSFFSLKKKLKFARCSKRPPKRKYKLKASEDVSEANSRGSHSRRRVVPKVYLTNCRDFSIFLEKEKKTSLVRGALRVARTFLLLRSLANLVSCKFYPFPHLPSVQILHSRTSASKPTAMSKLGYCLYPRQIREIQKFKNDNISPLPEPGFLVSSSSGTSTFRILSAISRFPRFVHVCSGVSDSLVAHLSL